MYLSSARRYRPHLWHDVVGQETIVTILRNEIITKTVSNAYLFCGQRGVGKTTIARIFAKAINCENSIKNNGDPCQECSYCKSACIFELDAASNNSVEDIRNIIDQIRFAPNFNNYNVFIIDEAHMLSNAAFNAFLKTLEEPPQNTVFILATTERHKLPITIVSRCQCFNFTNIPIDKIAEHIAGILKNNNIDFEKESLNLIAEKSDGAIRDALYILDSVLAFCNGKITNIAIERKKIWRAEIVMTIARILLIPMAISKIQKNHNIWRNRFSEFCYTVDANKIFYYCFTAFTLLVTTIISTFYQNILGYISLIGSFFVVFPAFFLPPLINILEDSKDWKCIINLIFGIILCIIGFISGILGFIDIIKGKI